MAEHIKAAHIKLIFGVPYPWPKEHEAEYLQVLENFNVEDLDTGASYPGSEQYIGDAGLSTKFSIHTKPKGWVPGVQTYQNVMDCAAQSFERLNVKSVRFRELWNKISVANYTQVKTYILHSPDPATPLSETYKAIQELYEAGKFEKVTSILTFSQQN